MSIRQGEDTVMLEWLIIVIALFTLALGFIAGRLKRTFSQKRRYKVLYFWEGAEISHEIVSETNVRKILECPTKEAKHIIAKFGATSASGPSYFRFEGTLSVRLTFFGHDNTTALFEVQVHPLP